MAMILSECERASLEKSDGMRTDGRRGPLPAILGLWRSLPVDASWPITLPEPHTVDGEHAIIIKQTRFAAPNGTDLCR